MSDKPLPAKRRGRPSSNTQDVDEAILKVKILRQRKKPSGGYSNLHTYRPVASVTEKLKTSFADVDKPQKPRKQSAYVAWKKWLRR